MAEHRTTFTAVEWLSLRVLVEHLGRAGAEDQKRLRDGLRGLGFYITDFDKAARRFGLSDLDRLLETGQVGIRG